MPNAHIVGWTTGDTPGKPGKAREFDIGQGKSGKLGKVGKLWFACGVLLQLQ